MSPGIVSPTVLDDPGHWKSCWRFLHLHFPGISLGRGECRPSCAGSNRTAQRGKTPARGCPAGHGLGRVFPGSAEKKSSCAGSQPLSSLSARIPWRVTGSRTVAPGQPFRRWHSQGPPCSPSCYSPARVKAPVGDARPASPAEMCPCLPEGAAQGTHRARHRAELQLRAKLPCVSCLCLLLIPAWTTHDIEH